MSLIYLQDGGGYMPPKDHVSSVRASRSHKLHVIEDVCDLLVRVTFLADNVLPIRGRSALLFIGSGIR